MIHRALSWYTRACVDTQDLVLIHKALSWYTRARLDTQNLILTQFEQDDKEKRWNKKIFQLIFFVGLRPSNLTICLGRNRENVRSCFWRSLANNNLTVRVVGRLRIKRHQRNLSPRAAGTENIEGIQRWINPLALRPSLIIKVILMCSYLECKYSFDSIPSIQWLFSIMRSMSPLS